MFKQQRHAKCLERGGARTGVENRCYREFIKQRTKEAFNKYKKYKNKLTSILQVCRKEYYSKILSNNKNNIKGIWGVLNSIIKKGTEQQILY